jgi:hypothetical protein
LALALDDLGEQMLKNIARPVQVYRVSATVAPTRSAQSPLSIAVLPFDNMSGTPEQGYVGDGIAENIITDLSRFRDLTVDKEAQRLSFVARKLEREIMPPGESCHGNWVEVAKLAAGTAWLPAAANIGANDPEPDIRGWSAWAIERRS